MIYFSSSSKSLGLTIGIILMLIGVVFLLAPDRVAEFIALFVGALIGVIGLVRIITVATRWQFTINRGLLLVIGVLLLGIGLYMLFNPDTTIAFVGLIISIFAILMALDRFVTANRLKREINVMPTVISGLIHLAFGAGMIYSAILVFSLIIIVAGIYLIIAGLMIVLSAVHFRDY